MNKSAYFDEYSAPMKFETKPIPDAPPQGAIVKVTYSGVCHTDVGLWLNHMKMPGRELPWILGHEVCGTVYSLGSEVQKGAVKIGDRVAVHICWGCRNCNYCKKGYGVECTTCLANTVGVGLSGGYQQYVPVKEAIHCVKVPDDFDMKVAALLPCSGLTTFNAVSKVREHVNRTVDIEGSCRLLIVGAGGLGLWATGFAKAMMPPSCKVIVADISEEKLELAKKAGADATVFWDPKIDDEATLVKQTIEACGGPIEAAVDLVGLTKTESRIFECARPGARWVCVGLLGDKIILPSHTFILKSLTVIGTLTGNLDDLKQCIEFVSKHKVKPPPIETIKLEDVTDALTKLHQGKIPGRSVIEM